MPRFLLPLCLAAVAALAPGAPQAQPQASNAHGRTPGDPWERTNRRVWKFNLGLDRAILRPLSRFTSGITPGPLGAAVHNFLVNLNEPVVIVNDLLQARPGPAVRSLFRLVVNSTIGGLGAIDVAKALGEPAHINGFGDTLGRWGVGPGPYLYLPVIGPGDVRDLIGTIVDDATLPLKTIDYPYRTEVTVTTIFIGGLNERAGAEHDLHDLLEGAADPYATLRSSYLQAREAQIRGEKALPPLPDIDEAPTTDGTGPAAGSSATAGSDAAAGTPDPSGPQPSSDAGAEAPAEAPKVAPGAPPASPGSPPAPTAGASDQPAVETPPASAPQG